MVRYTLRFLQSDEGLPLPDLQVAAALVVPKIGETIKAGHAYYIVTNVEHCIDPQQTPKGVVTALPPLVCVRRE